jgi:hypothetical protein
MPALTKLRGMLRLVLGLTLLALVLSCGSTQSQEIAEATAEPTSTPASSVGTPTQSPTPPLPPTDTPIPPTDTPPRPTESPVPPTDTAAPPTDTPMPPTATALPATDTAIPPTDTSMPPTATALPPTDTAIPATSTPAPPTETPSPVPTQPPVAEVVIVNVFNSGYKEYVEIANQGIGSQDLSGWTISGSKGDETFTFPSGYVLAAESTVRLHSGRDGVDAPPHEIYWTRKTVWNNQGETVYLRDAQGNLVDDYSY